MTTNDGKKSCSTTYFININTIIVNIDVHACTVLFCIRFPFVRSTAFSIDYYFKPFASVLLERFCVLLTTFGSKCKRITND